MLLLAVASALPSGATGELRATVVVSADLPVYEEALEGLRLHLATAMPELSLQVVMADPKKKIFREQMREVAMNPPDVLVAFGNHAATNLRGASAAPLVAGMLVDEQSILALPNATGVSLAFPEAMELSWVQKFLPRASHVGVLYNGESNGARIESAKQAARALGFELVAREVKTPKELPRELRALARNVDLLWGISDSTVLTPATAKTILSFSYENRIPFSGLSHPWVTAGALYALDRDYADLGSQCAELVVQILGGASPASIPPQSPRLIRYSINRRAARHLKLDLPASLLEGASEIVE